MRRRAGGAAAVVGHGPVGEVLVDLAWMHRAVHPNEVEQCAYVPAACRCPGRATSARVHEGLHGAGHEAVVHEEVLVHVESRIATLEVTGAVGGDPMAQREVLRARRCPDGVGLYETECVQRALEGCWREKTARDRSAPEVVEGHSAPLSTPIGDARVDARCAIAVRAGWSVQRSARENGEE